MKKLVSVLFALLLVGSFAFAADPGISFGGWGRMIFNATQGGDSFDDNMTSMGPSWAPGGRVKFSVAGNSDNVGFLTEVGSNGDGKIFVTDNAKIWVKINDMVKIQAGRIKQDVLRGKIGDDAFYGDPDAVFQRFYPKAGLLLDITPMEGLYIGAAIDAAADVTTITDMYGDADGKLVVESTTAPGYSIKTEDAFKNIQAGFGYVIPDVGHLRVQYVGADDIKKRYSAASLTGVADYLADLDLTDAEEAAEAKLITAYMDGAEGDEAKYMNVAFAYTAIPGLVVDAGAKLQLTSDTAQHTVQIDSSYSKDALSAIVRVGASFGDDGTSDDLGISGSWDVAYLVAAPMSVGFEGSVSNRGDDSLAYSLLPYAKAGYGNGYLKGGFKYDSSKSGDVADWAIPIVLEYWF